MAYSGTLVIHGQGRGVVVATGAQTEIGRISELVSQTQSVDTPLLRQMTQFGHWLTAAILGLAALTFAFGVLLRDYGVADMFLAAVSLTVAAIPEGLPAIMTITLAIGVQRMARRNAIIRRLPAVETLGAVTVICSDKTGTLSPDCSNTTSPGISASARITSCRPSRNTMALGESMWRMARKACSALPSCTNPMSAFKTTTPKITAASSQCASAAVTTPAAINT